ncbi:MAG: hypothetical protein HYV52_00600 [Parcubacteria group bacterium]|nr:hypothetical protein [Parcubacteria group bacterium]
MSMKMDFQKIFRTTVLPSSEDEDKARYEFISNVLLIASFGFSLVIFILNLVRIFLGLGNAVSTSITFVVVSFFALLYFLSRKGFYRFASYCLVSIFFLAATFEIYKFGVELASALLSYILIVVMAGVLIGTRFAFITTIVASILLAVFGYLQIQNITSPNLSWKSEQVLQFSDIAVYIIFFIVISIVSWLSNREIEKSLARARRSEADLKKERDSLEATVEKRTRELKETQVEKMTQLYRFAEFGRLSSGLFHDLINPLTAVSLNIEKVKNAEKIRWYVKTIEEKTPMSSALGGATGQADAAPISELSEHIDKAVVAAKKMEDMVRAVRKQLSRQETKTIFSVNEEIAQALEVLSHKAQKSGVTIRFFSRQEVKTYGDAVKFNQVALNLIANAIDSYSPVHSSASGGTKEGQEKENADTRAVAMSLSQNGDTIVFEVKDKGVGIPEENKPKLFEPFFTTKKEGYGIGIGLSMIKRIIEKDFGGSISVESPAPDASRRYGAGAEGKGSVFTVKLLVKMHD